MLAIDKVRTLEGVSFLGSYARESLLSDFS